MYTKCYKDTTKLPRPKHGKHVDFFLVLITATGPVLSMLFLTSCTHTSRSPDTDLELYGSSSLAGLHAHPIGVEGRKLEDAERKLGLRRAIIRKWLVARAGVTTLEKMDKDIADQAHDVYWIGSPSMDEEWRNIWSAKRDLRELERRKRLVEENRK